MRLSWKSCLVAARHSLPFCRPRWRKCAHDSFGPEDDREFCSPTGDVCYGIFNRGGKVYLRITTAARYFKRYNLCVRLLPVGADATHAQRCVSYPVFRQGGSTWESSINYARHFPKHGSRSISRDVE